jgi:2-methylaconitate cis-trans-isomerase PrpF
MLSDKSAGAPASRAAGSPNHVRAVCTTELLPIRATLMRGGSSKGAFFAGPDLPQDEIERAAAMLACYGSPDLRQIDGIGGADPLTSKAAVVNVSTRPDADVEYTFYQVGIDQPDVSTGGNCGNMLAGVGPFAILRGMIKAVEPETVVRIYTTNTRQVVTARIPVRDGLPAWDGDCSIAGVPGTGAAIRLDFGDCSGAMSGRLLPTGRARDQVVVDGRSIEVSLIDAATPFVFVKAEDVGATGRESTDEIRSDAGLMARLERVRGWAAVQLGRVADAADAAKKTPNVPRVMMVAPPADYVTPDGATIRAEDVDVCVRQLAMQRPHKALAVTGAACAAVASYVEGSVMAECAGSGKSQIRLGHPSGILRVAARTATVDGELRVQSAQIERTARLLMDGYVYLRASAIQALEGTVRERMRSAPPVKQPEPQE